MIYKDYDLTSIKLERDERDEMEALEEKAIRILMNKVDNFESGYFENLFIQEIDNKNKDSIVTGLARYVVTKENEDMLFSSAVTLGCTKSEYVKIIGSEVKRRCYAYEVFQHKGKTYIVANILPF